jgi:hypothetical protein
MASPRRGALPVSRAPASLSSITLPRRLIDTSSTPGRDPETPATTGQACEATPTVELAPTTSLSRALMRMVVTGRLCESITDATVTNHR